jgi:hypothetical protein
MQIDAVYGAIIFVVAFAIGYIHGLKSDIARQREAMIRQGTT